MKTDEFGSVLLEENK